MKIANPISNDVNLLRLLKHPALVLKRSIASTASTSSTRCVKALTLCSLSLSLWTVLLGSASAVGIEGTIQDSLGRALSDVRIELQTAQGLVISSTATNAQGRYAFKDLPQGTYAIAAQKKGFSAGIGISVVEPAHPATTDITLASEEALEIDLFAELKPAQRNEVSAKTGGSIYRMTAADIEQLPQGESTPLNQVLLDAPGVINDSFGQIHVRGDHANVQYQINGVILPQGLSGFGQSLDTRLAQSVDLLTGALPAQYGFNTAAVVDIRTKSKLEDAGSLSLMAGNYETLNPSFQLGGTKEEFSYFVTGSFLTNNVGIENPTPSLNPVHDTTHQGKGFGYLSYFVDATTKFTLMGGTYSGTYQIPNSPGKLGGSANPPTNPYYRLYNATTPNPYAPTIDYSANAPVAVNSLNVNDQQAEQNEFLVLSLEQSLSSRLSYQTSIFTNYATKHYLPDTSGNLYFNAVASNVLKTSFTTGLQTDVTYTLNESHTVKMGMVERLENVSTEDSSQVYALDPSTGVVTANPYSVADNSARNGNLQIGFYAQDAWQQSSKLSINYGLRFDYFQAFVNANQLSPRVGIVFKESESTTLHAAYSHYFTPPPNELVSTSTQNTFAYTTNAIPGLNSSVKAEIGDYYDLGVTQRVTQKYSIGIDAYLKNTQNTLDEGQFGPALILTPFNYAYGRIYGIEWTNSFKEGNFSAYLNISDNVSLAKNIISSQYLFDQQTLNYAANNWISVDHEQTHSLSGGTSYLWSGTRLSASMIYASGLREGFANTGTLPSYSVLNVGASRTIRTTGIGPLEYRLVINNALDRIYEIRDGSGIGVYAPQYGQRRAFYFGINKKF